MEELTEAEKAAIWEEVRGEFPHDEMMQDIHYVRLVHHYQTKDLPPEAQVEFYRRRAGKPEPAQTQTGSP